MTCLCLFPPKVDSLGTTTTVNYSSSPEKPDPHRAIFFSSPRTTTTVNYSSSPEKPAYVSGSQNGLTYDVCGIHVWITERFDV
ncbi:hypothetical protein RRG08_065022 [Elysia crispata]|uniref:Uncharacterized protein n=1 Tax=Elysia crispata TaxID=231223 RepID=A0AAE1D3L4_9GAST|nr:hypothetical protein RRG08_065022 [Elysia crispata]